MKLLWSWKKKRHIKISTEYKWKGKKERRSTVLNSSKCDVNSQIYRHLVLLWLVEVDWMDIQMTIYRGVLLSDILIFFLFIVVVWRIFLFFLEKLHFFLQLQLILQILKSLPSKCWIMKNRRTSIWNDLSILMGKCDDFYIPSIKYHFFKASNPSSYIFTFFLAVCVLFKEMFSQISSKLETCSWNEMISVKNVSWIFLWDLCAIGEFM